MKAVVLHEYGGPEKLKYEDMPDPVAGAGEVLVRVSATSINPIDWKIRSGMMKDMMPVQFPHVLGNELSGVVRTIGEGVDEFAPGDRVFALAGSTDAELVVVKAAMLAKVPEGLAMEKAGSLPLVNLTGRQVVEKGAQVEAGQTILIAGAAGGVGRSAVYTAKKLGARVLAGVRAKQADEARKLGADEVIALDDAETVKTLGLLDAVIDLVGHETGEGLLGKVKPGGVFATVTGPPANAAHHPTVRVVMFQVSPDPKGMVEMAEAVHAGKLDIPTDRIIALSDAAEGHAAAEKGGLGKIILVP